MQPKVSVIVPIYNVEQYISKCVDSILEQTLKGIEVILVNDCSPDNSINIIREYEKKYDNVIVIDSKVNLKQGGAKNLGMKIAKGEYIGFIDGDDYISPEMFEKLYNLAKENDADCAVCQIAQFWGDTFDPEKNKPYIKWTESLLALDGKELTTEDRKTLCVSTIGGLVTRIYRRKVVLDNEVFFPQGMKYEDNHWGFLINEYINKICFCKETLYYYRQVGYSTTHSINAKFQLDRYKAIELLYDDLKKRGLLEKYYDAIEYTVITLHFRNTYQVLTDASYFYPKEIVRAKKWMEEKFPRWYENKGIAEERERLQKIADDIGTPKWYIDRNVICFKRMILHMLGKY